MKLFNKEKSEQKSLGKMASSKSKEILETLSGKENNRKKRIIDNVIVFTGASGGTGVSTIVSNVAYMASQKGIRTIVIDLNIMYPTQHIYFSKSDDIDRPDLISYLEGRNNLGDSIESYKDISVLYANNRTLMKHIISEEDVAIGNFDDAIAKLRQLYDLVLIDCPIKVEHALCNEAFFLCDSIYLVWDEGISCIANTEKIRRNMTESGIEAYTKMNVILNKKTGIEYNIYPINRFNMDLIEVLPFEQDIIYNTLRSNIYCEKGSSNSKNANIFYNCIDELTDKILEKGGLRG